MEDLDIKYDTIHGAGMNTNNGRVELCKAIGISLKTDYIDKKAPSVTKNTEIVAVARQKGVFEPGIIPMTYKNHPNFKLDHCIIRLEGFMYVKKVRKNIAHAVTGVRTSTGDYKIVDPNGGVYQCDWRNPVNFEKLWGNKYPFHGWAADVYGYNVWKYQTVVYVNTEKLPDFDNNLSVVSKAAGTLATTNLGVNKFGRKILMGPRKGLFVLDGIKRIYIKAS